MKMCRFVPIYHVTFLWVIIENFIEMLTQNFSETCYSVTFRTKIKNNIFSLKWHLLRMGLIYDLAYCLWILYLIYCMCMSLSNLFRMTLSSCWPCLWSCLVSVIFFLVSSTCYPRENIMTPQAFTFTCPLQGQGSHHLQYIYFFAYHSFTYYLFTSCLILPWAKICFHSAQQEATLACFICL